MPSARQRIAMTSLAAVMMKPSSRGTPCFGPPRPVTMFRSCRSFMSRHRGNRTREDRSEEHTSELQSRGHLVCRLLLEKKKRGEARLLCELGKNAVPEGSHEIWLSGTQSDRPRGRVARRSYGGRAHHPSSARMTFVPRR